MTHKVKFGDVTIEVSEQAAKTIASLSNSSKKPRPKAEKVEAESKRNHRRKDKALAIKMQKLTS